MLGNEGAGSPVLHILLEAQILVPTGIRSQEPIIEGRELCPGCGHRRLGEISTQAQHSTGPIDATAPARDDAVVLELRWPGRANAAIHCPHLGFPGRGHHQQTLLVTNAPPTGTGHRELPGAKEEETDGRP